jgi:hypothetical protein
VRARAKRECVFSYASRPPRPPPPPAPPQGFLAALPYLCQFIVANIWSPLVDRWRKMGWGSTTFVSVTP